jgi:tellurite resistance protein TerC
MLVAWSSFFALVAVLLFVDLAVVNRKSHVVTMREAIRASVVWIAIGVAFVGFIWWTYAHLMPREGYSAGQAMTEYITALLVEKSLSVDNIFVIAMLMSFFRVPSDQQHRVLFWGIIGAVVFRGLMIAAGSALVSRFDWVFYIFGAILGWTAWRMLFAAEQEADPRDSRIVSLARRFLPLDENYHGDRFTVVIDGQKRFTLLFLVVAVIEGTDIVFAVDSIPAIFGFTQEPFIVMSSNVFAILGLRALYFVVAGAMREFRYLKISVGLILMIVAIKMFIHKWLKGVDNIAIISLAVVAGILTIGVVASILANRYARGHSTITPGPGEGDGKDPQG